jgi:hypothetical protein
MILGSGDRALVCAALGRFDDTMTSLKLSRARMVHYLGWAEPFYASVRGDVGALRGRPFHIWHGEIADRKYAERHSALAGCPFDPATDLIRSDVGLWAWRTNHPEIANMIEAYFASRREDGLPEAHT